MIGLGLFLGLHTNAAGSGNDVETSLANAGTAAETIAGTGSVAEASLANAGTAANFDPSLVSSATLKLWLDPTRGITGTTNITQWVDQSASAFTFAQSGTASTMVTGSGLNGRASIECSAGGYFTNASALSLIVAKTAWCAALVFQYRGADTEPAINNTWQLNSLICDSGGYWGAGGCSTTKVHGGQYKTGGPWTADTAAIAASTNYCAIIKYDGTKIYTSLNGNAFDAGTTQGNIDVTTGTLLVASRNSHISTFIGSIGDIVVYNSVPNADDLANLQAWAKAKYGL